MFWKSSFFCQCVFSKFSDEPRSPLHFVIVRITSSNSGLIATHTVAWYGLCGCKFVCVSVVTFVSPAKTAKPIEMPFGMVTRVGLRNHVLDGARSPGKRGNF